MNDARFTLSWRGKVAVLSVDGDVDFANAPEFAKRLEALAGNAEWIVVDLAPCRYIESKGWDVLVNTRRAIASVVIPAESPIRRFAEILSIDKFVPISATVDEAIASVPKNALDEPDGGKPRRSEHRARAAVAQAKISIADAKRAL
jgi:anti-anti-sigma factor